MLSAPQSARCLGIGSSSSVPVADPVSVSDFDRSDSFATAAASSPLNKCAYRSMGKRTGGVRQYWRNPAQEPTKRLPMSLG